MGFLLLTFLLLILQAIFFHSENYAKVPNYLLTAIKNFSSSFGLILIIILLSLLSSILILEEFFDDIFFNKEKKEINYIDLQAYLNKNSKEESSKTVKKRRSTKGKDLQSELYKKFSIVKEKEDLPYGKPKKLKANSYKDKFFSPSTFEEIFIDLEKSVKIKKAKIAKLELKDYKEDNGK